MIRIVNVALSFITNVPLWWGMLIIGQVMHVSRLGSHGKLLCLFLNFALNFKLLWKNNIDKMFKMLKKCLNIWHGNSGINSSYFSSTQLRRRISVNSLWITTSEKEVITCAYPFGYTFTIFLVKKVFIHTLPLLFQLSAFCSFNELRTLLVL